MPWNGSGVFTRLYSWVSDKNAGIDITSSRMDADTNDIVVGLEDCITLDGQNTPTHSLPMGGFTHTGVGNATARTNYAAAGQVVDGSLLWGGTSGGSGNVQTIAITPTVVALVTGQSFRFLAGFTNTSTATLAVNATAATAIRKVSTAGPIVLVGGEIVAGNTYDVTYDGTYFILNGPDEQGPSSWTPTDGSGAGLSLTVTNASYYRIGKQVIAVCDITMPATGSAAQLKIAGLPYSSFTTSNGVFGGVIVTIGGGITHAQSIIMNANSTTFQIWDNFAGTPVTNTLYSGISFRASLTYFTN